MVKKIIAALILMFLIVFIKETKTFEEIKKVVTDQPKTEIIITGDIMLGRSVMSKSLAKKDFKYPFLRTADILKTADITFGNLENPIIKNCPISNGGFTFCSSPEMISGLTFSGIDIVNLANNHTKNYGNDGLNQTQDYLQKEKIDYVGINNLIIKNVNQTKFGFLGFDFVGKSPNDSDYELIKNSKSQVDVLIIMIHWGNEYVAKSNNIQKEIAKNIINNGGDVIMGGHPHWVQEMDYIDGKPIFYSLGNFVFDQSWSEETKKGLVVRLNYQGKNLLGIDQMPIYMENFGQPKWVDKI